MGRSDLLLSEIYNTGFPRTPPVAILGDTRNVFNIEGVDLYDLQLKNFDINADWRLKHKNYNSIISTRCPYFSKQPEQFIIKCHEHLQENGQIFFDMGIGAHWSKYNNNFKIGWKKGDEHEYEYQEGNYLYATVWDDSFLEDEQYILFSDRVKRLGYNDTKQAIFDEVPSILTLDFIKQYFDIEYKLLALWVDYPQLYIFIKGTKK